MDNAMRKIVEADASARKALQAAKDRRDALPKALEESKKKIAAEYQKKAEDALQEANTESELALKEARKEIQSRIEKQKSAMQAKFQAEKEPWKAEILSHILDRKS